MKKTIFASMLAAVIIIATSTTSLAVEKVGNTATGATTAVSETATFLLSESGYLCGLLEPEEAADRPVIDLSVTAVTLSGLNTDQGKLVREKASHEATLTDAGRLATGGSTVACTLVVLSDGVEVLKNLNLFTADDVADATLIGEGISNGTYRCYHRFLDSNKGTEVARLHFPNTSHYASVRYADWDGDGDMELAFRAGVVGGKKSSSKTPASSGGDTTVENNSGNNVDTDWTIGGAWGDNSSSGDTSGGDNNGVNTDWTIDGGWGDNSSSGDVSSGWAPGLQ